MKTYKTWEVIKMLSEDGGLKFKNEYNDSIGVDNDGFVVLLNKDYSKHTDLFRKNVNMDWELIQEPVSFMEAITSEDTFRCEHLFIKESNQESYWTRYEFLKMLCDKFKGIGGNYKIKEIIKNGKFYINNECFTEEEE